MHWSDSQDIRSMMPDIQSLDELHDLKSLATKLGIKPKTITNWRLQLGLPYIRFGNIPYFSETQVLAWLNWYQRNIPDKTVIVGRKLAEYARVAKEEKASSK